MAHNAKPKISNDFLRRYLSKTCVNFELWRHFVVIINWPHFIYSILTTVRSIIVKDLWKQCVDNSNRDLSSVSKMFWKLLKQWKNIQRFWNFSRYILAFYAFCVLISRVSDLNWIRCNISVAYTKKRILTRGLDHFPFPATG